jgi:simple sugar transport system ATP-binding protein
MDEPTAVLTEDEAKATLSLARQLAAGGRAVVLITHKLRDVLGYTDRVTVMRAGATIIDGAPSAGMTADSLARAMVGSEPVGSVPRSGVRPQREILRLINISAEASEHGVPLHEVSLDVRGGEILGIAGVGGNGQAELVDVMIGIKPATHGEMLINESTAPHGPEARREAGLRFIPADRMGMGLFGELPLMINISIPRLVPKKPEKRWFVFKSWMSGLAKAAISEYEVAGAAVDIPVRLLSGGNAQKLMLAREFAGHFSILIAHSPTRGLDIRAVQAVQTRLRAATERNVAVLLISEDLDEIMDLSDRVAVMSHGRLSAAEPIAEVDRGKIGRLMLEMA